MPGLSFPMYRHLQSFFFVAVATDELILPVSLFSPSWLPVTPSPSLGSARAQYLPAYRHSDPAQPFDAFWLGTSLFSSTSPVFEGFEDSVRQYMEECDAPQGFQIIADADTAFAGLAAGA